jgi:hypothetical protein
MSQTFFNQLTDLNDDKDAVKDYIFVNRWRGIGAPNFANAQGWETTQVNIDQYLSLVLTDITTAQADATQALQDASTAQQAANAAQGDATTALAFVNAPISTDAGNVASLGTDNKVYVPQVQPNLSFYATTAASDVVGYTKLVTSVADAAYDDPAVDVSTGAIIAFAQPCGALVSEPGIIIGNPGVINVTTQGEIRRVSGNGTAEFYYEVYHRDALGVETLIGTSNVTPPINTAQYTQFSANVLFNNGLFLATDRIVIKFFANRIAGGSNPTYEFLFGGSNPVTTTFPIAAGSIAPAISTDPGNNAFLGSDGRIYVPTPAPPAADFKTIASVSTPATIANTNAETIFPTNLLIAPVDNLVGALYELHFNMSKGPAGHNSTIRAYINTSNNLSGSPVKVLEFSSGFNSNTSFPFFYRYFRNSIGLVVPRDVNAAQTVLSNLQTNSLVSTTPITFNPALTYYIVITTQMNVTNSNETLQFAKLCLTK